MKQNYFYKDYNLSLFKYFEVNLLKNLIYLQPYLQNLKSCRFVCKLFIIKKHLLMNQFLFWYNMIKPLKLIT